MGPFWGPLGGCLWGPLEGPPKGASRAGHSGVGRATRRASGGGGAESGECQVDAGIGEEEGGGHELCPFVWVDR